MMGPEQFWSAGMWIFPVIFLTILLGVVYLIFARTRQPWLNSSGQPERPSRSETALQILSKRYARGEMNREEFLEMKKDLE